MRPISAHREYVFPSKNDPNKSMNSQTENAALKRIGYDEKLVAHDLHSIASTAMNEAVFNADFIEAALALRDKDDVQRAYKRFTYVEKGKIYLPHWEVSSIKQSKLQDSYAGFKDPKPALCKYFLCKGESLSKLYCNKYCQVV